MKTHILPLLTLCLFAMLSYAQVGINTSNPDPNAALDIVHDSKGLLIPRISTEKRLQMNNPPESMLVYDTDLNLFYYYTGGKWYALTELKTTTNINASNKIESINTVTNGNLSVKKNITADSTIKANKFEGYGTIPIGGIIMWSGSVVPDGWALCDGQNGRPDLRERFILGASMRHDSLEGGNFKYVDNPSSNSIGIININTINGTTNYSLKINPSHLPAHSHPLSLKTTSNGIHGHEFDYSYIKTGNSIAADNGDRIFLRDYHKGESGHSTAKRGNSDYYSPHFPHHPMFRIYDSGEHTHNVSGNTDNCSSCVGQPMYFKIMPPYYALAFIMRIK